MQAAGERSADTLLLWQAKPRLCWPDLCRQEGGGAGGAILELVVPLVAKSVRTLKGRTTTGNPDS